MKRHFSKRIVVIVVLSLGVAYLIFVVGAQQVQISNLQKDHNSDTQQIHKLKGQLNTALDEITFNPSNLLKLTNAERTKDGLNPLRMNSMLATSAEVKVKDMVLKNYWSHNTPSGQTPWQFIHEAGYNYKTAGENLAYGFQTGQSMMTGWMNSKEHRENILNPTYTQAGFAVDRNVTYQGKLFETVVVVHYASPL